MLAASILTAAALGAGAVSGRKLAARGITARNALDGRQRLAYGVLLGVAGAFSLVYFAPKLRPLGWIPVSYALYAEEAVWPLVCAMAGFALGLIGAMEWPGRREPRRAVSAAGGMVLMAAALGYLYWRMLPITGILGAPVVENGVVMQTTSYSCAPATIATLARLTGLDTAMTEARVVEIARTTREGTTTLRELRAMRAVGFEPRLARRLTPDSLAAAGLPALLHVDEPVGSTRIRHAVALISADAARRTITIGNPLRGRQVIGFDQLPGYWSGEAIFAVTR